MDSRTTVPFKLTISTEMENLKEVCSQEEDTTNLYWKVSRETKDVISFFVVIATGLSELRTKNIVKNFKNMARRIKSLLFNAEFGENRVAHREHRSKRGRNRINKENSGAFYKYKKKKEDLMYGVDKKSLRYLKNRYKI